MKSWSKIVVQHLISVCLSSSAFMDPFHTTLLIQQQASTIYAKAFEAAVDCQNRMKDITE